MFKLSKHIAQDSYAIQTQHLQGIIFIKRQSFAFVVLYGHT